MRASAIGFGASEVPRDDGGGEGNPDGLAVEREGMSAMVRGITPVWIPPSSSSSSMRAADWRSSAGGGALSRGRIIGRDGGGATGGTTCEGGAPGDTATWGALTPRRIVFPSSSSPKMGETSIERALRTTSGGTISVWRSSSSPSIGAMRSALPGSVAGSPSSSRRLIGSMILHTYQKLGTVWPGFECREKLRKIGGIELSST